eukprot:GHVR01155626.1.p1 GENE.GHVR01155626.1~~GHVR01155626.1.p1  ORF type:complete len:206 (+),score=25.73 GHVR01155626.1:35-652(+)
MKVSVLVLCLCCILSESSNNLRRNLQSNSTIPLIVVNPGVESRADDPFTEALEDAVFPAADFLNIVRQDNNAIRNNINDRNRFVLNPVTNKVNTLAQIQRDVVLGSADAAYFAKMDHWNAVSGAPPQTYDTEKAPRQNQKQSVGTRFQTLEPFRSSFNPWIDEFFGHPSTEGENLRKPTLEEKATRKNIPPLFLQGLKAFRKGTR